MDKHAVAIILEEIATILELQNENPFKVRAYHNAARTIENLDEDLQKIIEEGRLQDFPGIGEKIGKKITDLVTTGQLPFYEKLKKSIPNELFNFLNIPNLGSKKIKILYDKLGIKTIEELEKACQQGDVAKLRGFGEKTQSAILNNLKKLTGSSRRFLWWRAMEMAQQILDGLLKQPGVEKAAIAGSLRRKLETVGDLDFIVASSNPEPVMEWFTTQIGVRAIIAKGQTKASVQFTKGMQADLLIVPKEQFAFALLYFTGSKEHNIKLRHLANLQGLTLNEYGLEPIDDDNESSFRKKRKKEISEEDIYLALNLPYIPPELREDRGEIEAVQAGKLPQLVEESDIRGVFHCHTLDSDGVNDLEKMVAAAQRLNWEFIGIADHSKASYQAHGMDEERLFKQVERIRKLNASEKFKTYIFAGVECDILADGSMDFSDDVLKELDFVIASVHRRHNLDENAMTSRIIKAVENPYTTILGHVSGRLLLTRKPYAINFQKIIDACIANGKIMELNSYPARLDMDWRYWHKAAEKGLKCAINPDAHSMYELQYYKAGVNMARKGWLEKKDIINCLPLKLLQAFLAK